MVGHAGDSCKHKPEECPHGAWSQCTAGRTHQWQVPQTCAPMLIAVMCRLPTQLQTTLCRLSPVLCHPVMHCLCAHHEDADLRAPLPQEGAHTQWVLKRHVLHNDAPWQRARQHLVGLLRANSQQNVHILIVLLHSRRKAWRSRPRAPTSLAYVLTKQQVRPVVMQHKCLQCTHTQELKFEACMLGCEAAYCHTWHCPRTSRHRKMTGNATAHSPAERATRQGRHHRAWPWDGTSVYSPLVLTNMQQGYIILVCRCMLLPSIDNIERVAPLPMLCALNQMMGPFGAALLAMPRRSHCTEYHAGHSGQHSPQQPKTIPPTCMPCTALTSSALANSL